MAESFIRHNAGMQRDKRSSRSPGSGKWVQMAKTEGRFSKVEMAVAISNFIYAFKVYPIFSKSQIYLLFILHIIKNQN